MMLMMTLYLAIFKGHSTVPLQKRILKIQLPASPVIIHIQKLLFWSISRRGMNHSRVREKGIGSSCTILACAKHLILYIEGAPFHSM